MAFAPIALTIPQYEDYPNYWLKAYDQGTVTPLAMATDATGGTTLAKAELDATGFPITAGSVRFIPFIDGDYDLWLFPTAAEADANDTTNAIQFADNLNTINTTITAISTASYAAGGGTVDIITATMSPAITAYTNGLQLNIRAAGANTIATPTININALGAKTITMIGNEPLEPGSIAQAGHEMILRYNSTNDVFELLNPALSPSATGETGVLNHAFAHNNVLRFIPTSLHTAIRAATNVTNLATYIQNAIDSVVTQGEIFFPRGTYLTTDITLPTAIEISLIGEGGSILLADTGTVAILTIPKDFTRDGHHSFRDLLFDGNSVTNVTGILSGEGAAGTALYISMYNLFVRNCEVGIDLFTSQEHSLYSVTCFSNTVGLKLRQHATSGGGNANGFYHCSFQQNTVGLFYDAVSVFPMQNNEFHNCIFQGNTLCGVAIFDSDDGLHFTTTHFEGNATAGTTLVVDTRTVKLSSIQIDNAKATFIDCGLSSVANPAIILDNGATIRLNNSYGYGLTSGVFIQGTLKESVEFYGYFHGLGRMTCRVDRWPDTFLSASKWMGIGKVIVTPSAVPVNDYVDSSPTVPALQNAVVATINADAGDSEMGMVSNATFTTAVGSTTTNRVIIDVLPTGIADGDTVIVTMLVRSDIAAIMGFSITSGSYIGFTDCPVDTKWRRLVMTFLASAANTPILYIYSADATAPTVKFAKLQATIIPSGGDLEQIQEILSLGLFNNNENEFFYTAAPTVGTWKVGDKVYDTTPSASGFIGWVCVSAGTPGTWKTFGAISA